MPDYDAASQAAIPDLGHMQASHPCIDNAPQLRRYQAQTIRLSSTRPCKTQLPPTEASLSQVLPASAATAAARSSHMSRIPLQARSNRATAAPEHLIAGGLTRISPSHRLLQRPYPPASYPR